METLTHYLSFTFTMYAGTLFSIFAVVFSLINIKKFDKDKLSVVILFDVLNVVLTLATMLVATLRLFYAKDASLYYIGMFLLLIMFFAFITLFIFTIVFTRKKKTNI